LFQLEDASAQLWTKPASSVAFLSLELGDDVVLLYELKAKRSLDDVVVVAAMVFIIPLRGCVEIEPLVLISEQEGELHRID
jgi:hypothetical protein